MMSDSKISALLSVSLVASPFLGTIEPFPLSPATEISTPSRASLRKMKAQLAPTPVLEPMGTYVGELQEKWQFPSDHLPIGMTYENSHIVSWNVLDARYMDWVIEKNSQGLSRSQIAQEHLFIEGGELTVRDQHVVDLILEMTQHATHPKQLFALQECSPAFLTELKKALPAHFAIVSSQDEALIFDQTRFDLVEKKEVFGVFVEQRDRSFQDLLLRKKDTGETIRLLNAHLPGDPRLPARYEFARYLADTYDPQVTTLAMGDMNFNELEMTDALRCAFPGALPPFSLYSPYCTNIHPYAFRSKVIDHFVVHIASGAQTAAPLQPDEVMQGLQPICDLLLPKDH